MLLIVLMIAIKTSDLNKKTVYIEAIIISIESIKYAIDGLLDIIYEKDENSNNEDEDFKYKDLLMQFRVLFLSVKDTGVVLNRDIEFVE